MTTANTNHRHGGTRAVPSAGARGQLLALRSFRSTCRAAALVLLALLAAITSGVSATAASREVSELPASLQKYVAGSPAWLSSPWMTAPSCREGGGDFSVWVENVIADTPVLLRVFHSSFFGDHVPDKDRPRSDATLFGYRILASDMQGQVPAGYCVNDITRWAGQDPDMKPFGFAWGIENTSIFGCTDSDTDTEKNVEPNSYRNRWVGAERAPCDGFHLRCDGATDSERERCAAWNAFSDRFVARVGELRAAAINAHPASGTAPVVETTSTGKTVLVIAVPVALLALVAVLGWKKRSGRRPTAARAAGGGGDGDPEK